MPREYGLGRGLSSLIPKKRSPSPLADEYALADDLAMTSSRDKNSDAPSNGIIQVDINEILSNPHQPRSFFNEEKLEELAQSIKHHGIIQPLIVSRKDKGKFELIAGERRLMASKKAGLRQVPAIVRDIQEKEKLELAIIENIQRHDLNPIEEAKAFQRLVEEYQMNQEEVALKMGKNRSSVANKIRLLNLPVEIQKALIEGKISEGHAKVILSIDNPEKQKSLFKLILEDSLTVRETEDKTRGISTGTRKRAASTDPAIAGLESELGGILGTKIKISQSKKGGKIIVDFYSLEELNGIIDKMKGK